MYICDECAAIHAGCDATDEAHKTAYVDGIARLGLDHPGQLDFHERPEFLDWTSCLVCECDLAGEYHEAWIN